MTQKDKYLLLRDLCARLPYEVILQVGIFDNGIIKYHNEKLDYHSKLLSLVELDGGYYFHGQLCKYSQFTSKPYLRPMSSMTEEEYKELKQVALVDNEGVPGDIPAYIDWLNAHHFDYRGLIEKGLAIEVTKENNPYKE